FPPGLPAAPLFSPCDGGKGGGRAGARTRVRSGSSLPALPRLAGGSSTATLPPLYRRNATRMQAAEKRGPPLGSSPSAPLAKTCRDRGVSPILRAFLMRLRCDRANGTAPTQVPRRSHSMSPRPDLGPKPRLGFAASSIERATERRPDGAALAALEKDRHARAYLVAGDQGILKSATAVADPLFALPEARALGRTTEIVFLGLCRSAPRFAIALEPHVAQTLKTRDEFVVVDLRSIAVQGLVEIDHLPALAEGKALLNWHARHRFCSTCGAATEVVEGGWRRDCPACKAQHFPRTDPVVIMLAVA